MTVLPGPSEQKMPDRLQKKCQIASKNAKQAETGWMLLVFILPDEEFGKKTVVLVKALIIAYKATNNYCPLEKQVELN